MDTIGQGSRSRQASDDSLFTPLISHVVIAAGLHLRVIQWRPEHEQISTTIDRYGHLAPGASMQTADVVANAIFRAMPITVLPEIENKESGVTLSRAGPDISKCSAGLATAPK
jgi:hypothetical protein